MRKGSKKRKSARAQVTSIPDSSMCMITPPGHEVLSLHHVHHHVDASRTSTVSLTRGSVREFLVDVGILYFCLFPASSRSKLFCSASSARFSAARIARSASSGRHTCRLPSWSHMAGFPVQRPRQKRQHRTLASQARLAPQARQKRQHRMRARQPKVTCRNRWDGTALEGPRLRVTTGLKKEKERVYSLSWQLTWQFVHTAP